VLQNHPDLVRGEALRKQADKFEPFARQRPNPELDSKGLYGEAIDGRNIFETESNLAHTFELGGKRSARIEKALAEKEEIDASYLKTKEDVYSSTLKILYRIRHVHAEMKTLEEALMTFSQIQRQYRSRPTLTPEQEVSLSVFQLAEGDYKFRKAALQTEENTLEKTIEISIGTPFPHKDSILPNKKEDWPQIKNVDLPLKGAAIKFSEAELKHAKAELSLAKSNSWPDLKLGPSFETETEGGLTVYKYGLNLSIPLPLYQVNSAGRAYAWAGLLKSEHSLELRKKELSQERQILLTQYQKATKSLKESVNLSEAEKKHINVDRLFRRGVIPSSLVIEAHRQLVDFTKSQNEQELIALEALLKLKALSGTLFEEGII
jgi:cobalt-zinc-cadmium efflux system outer membrane protein